MGINEKLVLVQRELKAPKGQFNKFGNYAYRSCEDIVESVKPILEKYNLSLTLNDEIVLVGDRFYIKATATISDGESVIQTTAYAREPKELKGMTESQITGATSSYARKYALNGLFAIDDTKDPDSNEYNQIKNKVDEEYQKLVEEAKSLGILQKIADYRQKEISDLTKEELQHYIKVVKEREAKKDKKEE